MLANDLVDRLCTAINDNDTEIAVAHDGDRMQPVYALIPTDVLSSLESFLASGHRKIDQWYALHAIALADFSDSPETFRNINTPQEHNSFQKEGLTV